MNRARKQAARYPIDDLATIHAVPFELPFRRLNEADGAFHDEPNKTVLPSQLAACFLFALGLLSLPPVYWIFTGGWRQTGMMRGAMVAAIAPLLIPTGVYMLGKARRTHREKARSLVFRGTRIAEIWGLTRRAEPVLIASGPLADCQLRVHEVSFEVLRDRTNTPRIHWNGYAAVFHLNGERMIVACHKKPDRLARYLERLPAPIRQLKRANGEPITGSADRRIW